MKTVLALLAALSRSRSTNHLLLLRRLNPCKPRWLLLPTPDIRRATACRPCRGLQWANQAAVVAEVAPAAGVAEVAPAAGVAEAAPAAVVAEAVPAGEAAREAAAVLEAEVDPAVEADPAAEVAPGAEVDLVAEVVLVVVVVPVVIQATITIEGGTPITLPGPPTTTTTRTTSTPHRVLVPSVTTRATPIFVPKSRAEALFRAATTTPALRPLLPRPHVSTTRP